MVKGLGSWKSEEGGRDALAPPADALTPAELCQAAPPTPLRMDAEGKGKMSKSCVTLPRTSLRNGEKEKKRG